MHIDDKEKMISAHKGMWSKFALSVIALFEDDKEITTKELAERSKQINSGHPFNENAINKVLTRELKEIVISCGKNKWKLKEKS
jgi:hypothetical protein